MIKLNKTIIGVLVSADTIKASLCDTFRIIKVYYKKRL